MIQTDKAVYKPGDKVQFRVLVLDAKTKPYQLKNINVNIADSHGTDYDVDWEKEFPGVYVGSLEISDSPPLGKWKIDVSVDDSDTTTQFFEVSEYVLPRFSANIDCSAHVLLSDKKFKVTVFGEYTFGEFVEATATITALVYDADKPEILKSQKQKISKVSAKKNIEFEFLRDLKLNKSGLIKIHLIIEENSTGKKAHDSRFIIVHEVAKHKIQLIRNENKMKPGFPYEVEAIVRQFNESVEISEENKVKFRVLFYQSRPKTAELLSYSMMEQIGSDVRYEETSEIGLKNGIAKLKFDVPKTALGVTVTAKYLNVEASVNITRYPSQCKEYLKAELVTER
jgi:CD109 antigen